MATLQSFYPWVSVDCPGVPAVMLDDAILRGAREFCKATHAIEYDGTIASVISQTDYEPTLDSNTEIVAVKQVKQGTTYLTADSLENLEALTSNGADPTKYAVVETLPLSIRFYPSPIAVKTYNARFAVMPTINSSSVDDKLFEWYRDAIIAYAKYWLMVQPGKDWSNADQAAFEWNRFTAQCSDARIRRSQWRSDLPNQVQMNPFA